VHGCWIHWIVSGNAFRACDRENKPWTHPQVPCFEKQLQKWSSGGLLCKPSKSRCLLTLHENRYPLPYPSSLSKRGKEGDARLQGNVDWRGNHGSGLKSHPAVVQRLYGVGAEAIRRRLSVSVCGLFMSHSIHPLGITTFSSPLC